MRAVPVRLGGVGASGVRSPLPRPTDAGSSGSRGVDPSNDPGLLPPGRFCSAPRPVSEDLGGRATSGTGRAGGAVETRGDGDEIESGRRSPGPPGEAGGIGGRAEGPREGGTAEGRGRFDGAGDRAGVSMRGGAIGAAGRAAGGVEGPVRPGGVATAGRAGVGALVDGAGRAAGALGRAGCDGAAAGGRTGGCDRGGATARLGAAGGGATERLGAEGGGAIDRDGPDGAARGGAAAGPRGALGAGPLPGPRPPPPPPPPPLAWALAWETASTSGVAPSRLLPSPKAPSVRPSTRLTGTTADTTEERTRWITICLQKQADDPRRGSSRTCR